MGSVFSSPSPPPPPPPPPTREDPAVEEAARKARIAAARAKGRQSTILTSGQGVADQAPIQTKTLLGS